MCNVFEKGAFKHVFNHIVEQDSASVILQRKDEKVRLRSFRERENTSAVLQRVSERMSEILPRWARLQAPRDRVAITEKD